MSFADTYFKRFQTSKKIISEEPNKNLILSVVIPSFNEADLCNSLRSLKNCTLPEGAVEVIVVINSSDNTPADIVELNRQSYISALEFAEKNNVDQLKFHIINLENLPKKNAGVGLARKIGMDEALRRFNVLNNSSGLIAGFDADALVQDNYFKEIENQFIDKPETNACSIYFEHPTDSDKFDPLICNNIINYELHLRYFVEALRYAEFPFAYHTVGSSFVVKAKVYAMQGGMNKKKAGEDFYFLQKIIPLGNYSEINSTKVIPSPRMSDRVPFGTGAAVKKMIDLNIKDYSTYDLEVFELLKKFFKLKDLFFENYSSDKINLIISEFLNANNFEADLKNIVRNSPNIKIFRKRFYDWFNAFRVIKFLNFAHEIYFKRMPVLHEAENLLRKKYPEITVPTSEKNVLELYRKIQRSTFEN